MEMIMNFGARHSRKALILVAALVHGAFLVLMTFQIQSTQQAAREQAEVFKLVDVREMEAPKPKVQEAPPPEQTLEVPVQSSSASEVIETDKTVVETRQEEPVYVPQHKISTIPVLPGAEILSKIKYPDLAARQGIEGVVYLELFIDKAGVIRRKEVLKDPGFGFAEAALAALEGVVCQPASANGEAVAVRFRYPVRFSLK